MSAAEADAVFSVAFGAALSGAGSFLDEAIKSPDGGHKADPIPNKRTNKSLDILGISWRAKRLAWDIGISRCKLAADARLETGIQPEKLPASMELAISGVIGLLCGSVLAWLVLRSQTTSLSTRLLLTEKELVAAKAELARLSAALTEQVAGRARLESALELERKASTEKMELVTQASDELRNAFKAMASDALKSNNLSFLELARTSLERFQSEAKGDLESRQKAVASRCSRLG